LSTERIDIYGGKATIKQNKFGVRQFRMWLPKEAKQQLPQVAARAN